MTEYYTCSSCPYETTSKSDLDRHFEAKHQSAKVLMTDDGKVAYCKKCNRVADEWLNERGEVNTTCCKICGTLLHTIDVHKIDAIIAAGVAKVAGVAKAVQDSINPSYYHGRDVMDIINRYKLSFCEGQVIKYVLRAKMKNGVEDLQKALWYLKEEISQYD